MIFKDSLSSAIFSTTTSYDKILSSEADSQSPVAFIIRFAAPVCFVGGSDKMYSYDDVQMDQLHKQSGMFQTIRVASN
jgi:hypothetical protein